jgi:predicted transposase YbfD/YdcC
MDKKAYFLAVGVLTHILMDSIGMVEVEREIDGVVSRDRRYYLCSVSSVKEFAHGACGHWSIKNGLHCVLDVAFREDHNRTRSDHSTHNFAILRHIALNLLKAVKSVRVGVKGKCFKCGWDRDYLFKVLLCPSPI